ncbi:WD40 repeat domain-containing protein, partial [Fulvimarina sp. MAC3]
MAPFTPAQIESYFLKTLGETDGRRAYASVARTRDLAGLAQKPIMARYIAEIAPDLEVAQASGTPINVATVYRTMFRRTLERDREKNLLLSARDRQKLLVSLALHLWRKRSPSLSIDELEDWFDQEVSSIEGLQSILRAGSAVTRNLLQTELRNASLLVRAGEQDFRFVHTSFQEFFLAEAIWIKLRDGSLGAEVDFSAPSLETAEFLFDIVETEGEEHVLSSSVDEGLKSDWSPSIRQFLVNLVQQLWSRDQRYKWPAGANLSHLDFRKTQSGGGPSVLERVDYSGSNLLGAHVRNVTFKKCDFSNSVLSQICFEDVRFVNCTGKPIGLTSARFFNTHADEASRATVLKRDGLHFSISTQGNDLGVTPLRISLRSSPLSSAVFSPDGQLILTGGSDGTARLWDAGTGSEVRRFEGHWRGVQSAVFSPDGQLILTGGSDGTARLWDVGTGSEVRRFEGHGRGVQSAVFSPDGQLILTGGSDGTARLWDAGTGSEVRRFEGHGEWVRSAVFSPDGPLI